jgi:hypothetical protein
VVHCVASVGQMGVYPELSRCGKALQIFPELFENHEKPAHLVFDFGRTVDRCGDLLAQHLSITPTQTVDRHTGRARRTFRAAAGRQRTRTTNQIKYLLRRYKVQWLNSFRNAWFVALRRFARNCSKGPETNVALRLGWRCIQNRRQLSQHNPIRLVPCRRLTIRSHACQRICCTRTIPTETKDP